MSIKAHKWAKTIKTGSPTLKAVLCAIAHYADEEGRAWPSLDRVAEDTEFSARAVRKAVAELAGMGLLTREERFRADGGRSTDVLTLQTHISPPLERGATPLAPPATPPEPDAPPLAAGAGASSTTCIPRTTTELPLNVSEADASGGSAADELSVKDLLWRDGKANLLASGMTAKDAGAFLGSCLKRGYPHALVLEGTYATVESASGDPIRYMGGFLRKADEDGRGARPRASSAQKPRSGGQFLADLVNGKSFGGSDDTRSDPQRAQFPLISSSRH